MTQFHEGQDVEVAVPGSGKVWKRDQTRRTWRNAKIVAAEIHRGTLSMPTGAYHVQFPDGTHAVFDAEHIRANKSLYEQRNDGPVFAPSEEQIDRGFYD